MYKELKDNGIVTIANILDLESNIQAIKVIEEILSNGDADLLFTKDGIERKICYAFSKNDLFLDIISNPSVIKILKEVYGNKVGSILPTWEDILIKAPLNGIPVEVHQDLGLPSLNIGEVFSLSFYFNDADDNPVYYLKGSHKHGALTRTEIQKFQNKELYTPYTTKAGDVNIHNVLTIHFSEANQSKHPRYTWYVEFRTIEQIVNDSPWNLEWAMKRQAILAFAIENRKKKGLEYTDIQFDSLKDLRKFIDAIDLRVPHLIDGVNYSDNEYNHFMDHKTLF